MLTGDLNIVDVEWIIQYRIVDPRAWLFTVQEKDQTIRDISRSVINTLVGDRAILDVMSSERSNIENLAVSMMNEQFSQLGLGINVFAVKLQNIVPPEGVQDAFEDVNKAIQDMNRFINEGKESYNSEIPKAKGEADRQIQVADGYAAERVNKAKGDVARFNSVYEEYRKAPAVTRERLYLETMEEIFASGAEKNPALIDSGLDNVLPFKNLGGKMAKQNKFYLRLAAFVAAVVILLAAGPFYIVNEGDQAVVIRFGQIVKSCTSTGLYFKIPFLDVVTFYPAKILSLEGDQARIPTKENQFIIVDTTSRWKISDPALFYQSFKTLDAAYNKLSDVIDSSTRTIITRNRLSEIVRSSNLINEEKDSADSNQLAGIEGEDSAEIEAW